MFNEHNEHCSFEETWYNFAKILISCLFLDESNAIKIKRHQISVKHLYLATYFYLYLNFVYYPCVFQ